MLDTPTYFKSRWTSEEFGRALAKGISVLRIGWPDVKPSPRTATTIHIQLSAEEIEQNTGRLVDKAVEHIRLQIEKVRSQSQAVRFINLVSKLREAIQMIGGDVIGMGSHRAVHIRLPDDQKIVVYPIVGVPTSTTLHDAATNSPSQLIAIAYDHIGFQPQWQEHLDWLSQHIHSIRWIKASEAS